MHRADPLSVFLNVPFDAAYEPLFEALVFAITASGYRVRCALEEEDSGDVRMDKLVQLIQQSPRSMHDLSRTDVPNGGLPRFNMPFELGLVLGAKRFHPRKFGSRSIRIMVAEQYKLPKYLSDLEGNDPSHHDDQPAKVIEIVQKYLQKSPGGVLLKGPSHYIKAFQHFQSRLPDIAQNIGHTLEEVRGFANYRTYLSCVTEYLKAVETIDP